MMYRYFKDVIDEISVKFSQDISGIQFWQNYGDVRVDIAFKDEFDFVSRASEVCLLVTSNAPKDFFFHNVNADYENCLVQAEWGIPEEL